MDSNFQKVLEEHLGLFLLAVFFSLVTCFLAYYRNFFKWSGFEKSSVRLSLFHMLFAFLIYFGISFFVPFILIQIIKTFPANIKQQWSLETDALKAWLNLINIFVLLLAFLWYLAKLSKESRTTVLGARFYHGFFQNVRHFLMGVLTFVISFPIVLAISQIFTFIILYFELPRQEQVAIRFLKSTMENPALFAITSLFVVFIVPTIEELLFRGFLQNWLAKFLGRGGGIILTALIFAFFHFSISQGWGNLEIIPSLFILALFLGFIYFRQQSIVASIGLHAAFNAANIALISLSS